MTATNSPIPFKDWLQRARNGDSNALGMLLDGYRNYLRLLARMQLSRMLQVRISPSDLAQESILTARTAFGGFRGSTEPQLLGWLRKILATELIDATRFHSAKRRDIGQEQRLDDAIEQSSVDMGLVVTAPISSPSQAAIRRERSILLAEALDRLPADYSEVIVQKHLESRSFPEIAERMDRSVASVKSIWTRAMTKLRYELGEEI